VFPWLLGPPLKRKVVIPTAGSRHQLSADNSNAAEGNAMSTPQFLHPTIILPVSDIYETVAWYERAFRYGLPLPDGS